MRPRRGAVVPELAPRRLVEMFELMAELEAMCGRLAARRMSDTDHRPLVHAQEACEAVRQKHDPDGYYHQNEVFHHVIYEGEPQLVSRRAGVSAASPPRPVPPAAAPRSRSHHDLSSEHRQIVTAILAGDGDKAAELLREHVLVGAEKFTDLMASLGRLSSAPPLEARAARRRRKARRTLSRDRLAASI